MYVAKFKKTHKLVLSDRITEEVLGEIIIIRDELGRFRSIGLDFPERVGFSYALREEGREDARNR